MKNNACPLENEKGKQILLVDFYYYCLCGNGILCTFPEKHVQTCGKGNETRPNLLPAKVPNLCAHFPYNNPKHILDTSENTCTVSLSK